MRRKLYVSVAAVLVFAALLIPAAAAAEPVSGTPEIVSQETPSQAKLTDAQKKELKQLFDKKAELDKQIIQKYADFGVITKEQANQKLQRINKRLESLESNGYIPKYPKGVRKNMKKPAE